MFSKSTVKFEREHVTLYIKNHLNFFRVLTMSNACDESRYRITVDNMEDFEVIKEVIEHFIAKGKCFIAPWTEIRAFLDANPKIFKINAYIQRNEGLIKSLREDKSV